MIPMLILAWVLGTLLLLALGRAAARADAALMREAAAERRWWDGE